MENQQPIICIAWFRREQWFLLKLKAADSALIEDTYDEWEKEAEKLVQKVIALGQQLYKIDVDVFELEKWCKEKGLPNDSNARSQFAAEKGVDMDNQNYDLNRLS